MKPLLIRRTLRAVLFTGQVIALFVGAWVIHLAILFRPYCLCGSFLCSFQDEYYRMPPIAESGDSVNFDVPIYVFQFVLIVWVTSMVILLLRKCATKRAVLTHLKASAAGVV